MQVQDLKPPQVVRVALSSGRYLGAIEVNILPRERIAEVLLGHLGMWVQVHGSLQHLDPPAEVSRFTEQSK